MKHKFLTLVFLGITCASLAPTTPAWGALITSGQAVITVDIPGLSAPPGALSFDRFYGVPGAEAATLTYTQMVSGSNPVPSGAPSSANNLVHPVNGTVTSPTLRFRQSTTLDYDSAGILASWNPSTWDGFFVLNDGEQIGLDGVIRLNLDPLLGGGNFLFGDYGLRYSPLRPTTGSGLVLTNNFDSAFVDYPLFDIGNASINATPSGFTITGDLFLTPEYVFFFGGTPGSDVGDFNLTALTSSAAVPEPSSLATMAMVLGIAAAACYRRQRLYRRRSQVFAATRHC